MVKEAASTGGKKPEILKSFNSRIRNTTEDAVIDWINKYFLDDSNLALIDFNDRVKLETQVRGWTEGVLGRIRHQLVLSGIKNSDRLDPLIAYYFYDHISHYPRYADIREFLPSGVRVYDPSLQKKAPDAETEEKPAA